ncbi:hypothetical protein C4572_03265 [Candidatus Parcubacteria bacterium]|nr:MAG: hypothetical protein C4572_03265 [Candidatus Parcubacteria bacterium]
MWENETDKYSIKRDLYRFSIKKLLLGIEEMGFEVYLREYSRAVIDLEDLFRTVFITTLRGVEYAVKKDKRLLKFVGLLILRLEKEDEKGFGEETISGIFADLLKKAIEMTESEGCVDRLSVSFEYNALARFFMENILPKIAAQEEREIKKVFLSNN